MTGPSRRTMRCRRCGYDLRGLPEHRCPECGRAFHPTYAWTYLTKPVSGRRRLRAAVGGVVLIAIPLAIAYLQDLGWGLTSIVILPVLFIAPAMLVVGFVIECQVLRTSAAAMLDQLPWTEHRQSFAAAFVVSLVVVAAAVGAVVYRLSG